MALETNSCVFTFWLKKSYPSKNKVFFIFLMTHIDLKTN